MTGVLTVDHRAAYDRLDELRDSIDDGEVDDLESLAEAETQRSLGTDPFFENEKSQLEDLIRSAVIARDHDMKLKTFLDEIVEPIMKEGRKLLVFTEYRATQDYLFAALMKHHLGV